MFVLLLGVMVPFFGTILGAFLVFFMKNKITENSNKILLGFASGVMMASSIWSLIIPALEADKTSKIRSILPVISGVILGVVFLIILDKFCLKINQKATETGASLKREKRLLFWSITIHNIPEGMAVGVALASAFFAKNGISIASALALSIGIAIQNIPEGAIVSLPLKNDNMTKSKAFSFGVFSGIVEPIFAGITILLTKIISPALPYLLSFAAGAMIFVSVGELIPESQGSEKSKLATISFFLGFLIMMILDVILS